MDAKRQELIDSAQKAIGESSVPDADKKIMFQRIPYIAEPLLEMFVQVCKEDPLAIDAVVKSLKKKLDAQGNLKKIHEIIKQERVEIEELIAA